MNLIFSNKNRTKGFTLIELLTVVAIIGILASILIPTIGTAKVNANKAKTKAMFSQWALSLDLFKSEYGYYPTIGTSNKLVPASFFAALTGKTYAGATPSDLKGNKRKLSFYSPATGDVDTSGNLLDAFGNTDFVVFTDTDNNGIINTSDTPALSLQPVTSIGGTTLTPTNGTTANSGQIDLTNGVRAGVIFYSAGRGDKVEDIVTSW